MLRHTSSHSNPLVVAAIEQLFDEDRQFERNERRMSFRESFSRPVTITMRGGKDGVYNGFSKNVSFEGIGVISQHSFEPGSEAKIEIHSSNNLSPVIVSKMAWCKPFGEGWYISGWLFVTAVRG